MSSEVYHGEQLFDDEEECEKCGLRHFWIEFELHLKGGGLLCCH